MKVTYAKRLPQLEDRWQIGNEIFESLTECLNEIFIREQRHILLRLMLDLVRYSLMMEKKHQKAFHQRCGTYKWRKE